MSKKYLLIVKKFSGNEEIICNGITDAIEKQEKIWREELGVIAILMKKYTLDLIEKKRSKKPMEVLN